MKTVEEICGAHLGKRLRVETTGGAIIEGTLNSIAHSVTSPWGSTRCAILTFEEYVTQPKGEPQKYVAVETYGNRSASVLPDE